MHKVRERSTCHPTKPRLEILITAAHVASVLGKERERPALRPSWRRDVEAAPRQDNSSLSKDKFEGTGVGVLRR